MKFSKYLLLILACVCQQGYAVGKVIFKNNAGVDVTIDHTTRADRGEFHGAQAIKPGGMGRSYEAHNFIASDMSAPYNISEMRVIYGTSVYHINMDRLKTIIRQCMNGDVIVEIQPKPWFGNEAPVEIRCK